MANSSITIQFDLVLDQLRSTILLMSPKAPLSRGFFLYIVLSSWSTPRSPFSLHLVLDQLRSTILLSPKAPLSRGFFLYIVLSSWSTPRSPFSLYLVLDQLRSLLFLCQQKLLFGAFFVYSSVIVVNSSITIQLAPYLIN